MPTRAEKPPSTTSDMSSAAEDEGGPAAARHLSSPSSPFQEASSWTDDLPVCHLSGVGFSTNQVYREDGVRREEHPFEDRSFHFHVDGDFLYGVLDGEGDAGAAATFAAQRFPAELLLGQLSGSATEVADPREALRSAFGAVERGFFQWVDERLAERVRLQCELPEGLTSYQAYQRCPDLARRLAVLDEQVAASSSAVLALVSGLKLYVANVGDCRALLCRTDVDGVLRVVQLSVDHIWDNEDEVLRLSQLGVDVKKSGGIAGGRTRCIGNYMVKGGYKETEGIKDAASEPVVAEPEIHGGIPIDDSCRFLLLMSNGLPRSLEEAAVTDNVNRELAHMVVEQFRTQSTLTGVAQAVVDRVARIHHDAFMTGTSLRCQRREDMTLLVRNFSYPLPNASRNLRATSPLPPGAMMPPPPTPTSSSHPLLPPPSTNTSTESSSEAIPLAAQLPLDEDGRIEPYVSFDDYYKAVDEARKQGQPLLPLDDFD